MVAKYIIYGLIMNVKNEYLMLTISIFGGGTALTDAGTIVLQEK